MSCLLSFSIRIYSLSYFFFSLFVRFLWQVVCAMGSNWEWKSTVCHLSLMSTEHGGRWWCLFSHKITSIFFTIYLDWCMLQQNKEVMCTKETLWEGSSAKPQATEWKFTLFHIAQETWTTGWGLFKDSLRFWDLWVKFSWEMMTWLMTLSGNCI